ncbi:MAG TPA: SNF2-related protein, partial [Mycobacteriales bacterium]|nr:SNF2-related protein [Mycobacteriales bacterium]
MPPRARRRTRGGQPVPGHEGAERQPQRNPETQRAVQPPRSPNPRRIQDQGPIAVLAVAAAGVDQAVTRHRVSPGTRAQFQAIALLLRTIRAEAKAAKMSEVERGTQLKRIEGLAAALARTAARDATLFALLADDTQLLPGTSSALRELRVKAGLEEAVVDEPPAPAEIEPARAQRQVVPQSAISRSLANPFLAPDYSAAQQPRTRPRLLADWELVRPLLRAFEQSTAGAPSCMTLPAPADVHLAAGLDLMPHQAQVLEAVKEGHRTFLLADEPGLGKTAQALLAAQAANAFPLLVVVPNVVKATWAREATTWTPRHPSTVIHGDGEDVDAFADIIIVNYDILDRHVGWLSTFGFRGMVVDEAHFIKNKNSQRSQHVLELSRKIRQRTVRPLLMALTGTPLINDIEDFLAIWEFLAWITDKGEVSTDLVAALEENGMTPIDSDFYPAARQTVIERGIVRRQKVDVAKDIPARRIADMPVELEGALGSSVKDAERKLVRRLVKRYESTVAARKDADQIVGVDASIVRQVCARELRESDDDSTGDNVFSMMRRIGQAKAELAADYTAQLARSAGKVVFFAKHIDVMD